MLERLFKRLLIYYKNIKIGGNMRPELFNIFGFHIYGYGLMIAIGIICAQIYIYQKCRKKGL